MIKAVIFDIDNTLYDYDNAHATAMKALYQYTNAHFGWSEEETSAALKTEYSQFQDEIGKRAAIHNRLIRFQRILEKKGLPLHPHALNMYNTYWDTLIAYATVFPNVKETLGELRDKGLILGVGTNMTSHVQFRKLTAFGLLEYFSFIVSSEEADYEKPQKDIFLKCAAKAHCDPSQCVYVGDSLIHDIVGAQNAGMPALWFRPAKVNPFPSNSLPVDYVDPGTQKSESAVSFQNFSELPQLISSIK